MRKIKKEGKKLAKRALSLLMAASMMFSSMSTAVFATGDVSEISCTHHTEHTVECGYVAPSEGSVCKHEHDETCGYVPAVEGISCTCAETEENIVLVHKEGCGYVEAVAGVDCNHVHGEGCSYVEAVEGKTCECTATDDNGALVHSEGCGYVEAVAGVACDHVHDENCNYVAAVEGTSCNCAETEENFVLVHKEGCGYVEAKAATDCAHAHDTNCGYAEAVGGSPCKFDPATCAECAAAKAQAEQKAQNQLNAAITALYDKLMAFETGEALKTYIFEEMSEEEELLMAQFSDEQNAAVLAKMEEQDMATYANRTVNINWNNASTDDVVSVTLRSGYTTQTIDYGTNNVIFNVSSQLGLSATVNHKSGATTKYEAMVSSSGSYNNRTYTVTIVNEALTDRGDSYNHIDIKVAGEFTMYVDGQPVTLKGMFDNRNISTNTFSVRVGNQTYNMKGAGNQQESDGMLEYTTWVNLSANDIDWVEDTFAMSNVYVTGRLYLNLGEYASNQVIFKLLKDILVHDEVGYNGMNYYYQFTEYQYKGIQECTNNNGMRSNGKTGPATGLDLFITASELAQEVAPNDTIQKKFTGTLPTGLSAYPNVDVSIRKVMDGETHAQEWSATGSYTLGDKVWSGNLVSNATEATKLGTVLSEGIYAVVEAVQGYEDQYTASFAVNPPTHVVNDNVPVEIDNTENCFLFAVHETDVKEDIALTLTNNFVDATVPVTVRKEWVDNNSSSRPNSVTVHIKDGENVVRTLTLSEDNGWSATVYLPKLADNAYYTVSEEVPNGYVASIVQPGMAPVEFVGEFKRYTPNSNTINTTHGGSTLIVSKKGSDYYVWTTDELTDAQKNQLINRLASVDSALSNIKNAEVEFKSGTSPDVVFNVGGETVNIHTNENKTVTLTFSNKNAWSWFYESEYEIKVNATEGVITNTKELNSETVSVTVNKSWITDDLTTVPNGATNSENKIALDFQLLRNNTTYATQTVEFTITENTQTSENTPKYTIAEGSYTWTDLPKYDNDGNEIDWDVAEILDENSKNYWSVSQTDSKDSNGNVTANITNTYDPSHRSLLVSKIWYDGNSTSSRPANGIAVQLQYTTTKDGADNWIGWDDVDNTALGGLFAQQGYEVTGTATLTSGENGSLVWAHIWNNLPKYADGNNDPSDGSHTPIAYRVVEIVPDNYKGDNEFTKTVDSVTRRYSASDAVDADSNSWAVTLTNTLLTKATVTKVWADADNQDGKRPSSLTVTLSNGTEVTLNEANNWTATVNNLPKYDAEGKEIVYTWKENGESEGKVTFNGAVYAVSYQEDGNNTTYITNTHTPETTSATVKKVWADADDQAGFRPDSLTVTLTGTLTGTVDGQTNPVSTKEVILSAGNDGVWQDSELTYTESSLPMYSGGKLITYTWKEANETNGKVTFNGAEYSVTYNGLNDEGQYVITNTHTPETTTVTVKKSWNVNDFEGALKSDITVKLLKNNVEYPDSNEVLAERGTIPTDTTKNTVTWDSLPKFENGQEIKWDVVEVLGDNADEWSFNQKVTKNTDGTWTVELTNTYDPVHRSLVVNKIWQDSVGNVENAEGFRPKSIYVRLQYRLGENDTWKDVPNNNNPIDAKPTGVLGSSATEEHFFQRFDGLVEITNKDIVAQVDESHQLDWGYIWVGLPQYADHDNRQSTPIQYRVVEVVTGTTTSYIGEKTVDNENVTITGSWTDYYTYPDGGVADRVSDGAWVFSITNSREAEKTSATVKKVWDDVNNQDGKRPDSVTVTLMKGNSAVKTVTLNAANNWTYTESDLPKYENGAEIVYTWKEANETNGKVTFGGAKYSVSYAKVGNTTTITNSYTPATIALRGQKVWNDNNNQDGYRPERIQIELYKRTGNQSQLVASKQISGLGVNTWNWEFTNLPKYENGTLITYFVIEDAVSLEEDDWKDKYSMSTSGTLVANGEFDEYTITNTHVPETVKVTVNKTWRVPNDYSGNPVTPPNNVQVRLLKNNVYSENLKDADGLDIVETRTFDFNEDSPEVNSRNPVTSKTIEWTNLPKFEGGKEIVWDVEEILGDNADDWYVDQSVTKEGNNITVNMTNHYDQVHRSLLVNKVWKDTVNDVENAEGLRPESITVQLEYSIDNGANWYPVPENANPSTGLIDSNRTLIAGENSNAADYFARFDGTVTLKATPDTNQPPNQHQLDWGYIWVGLPRYTVHNNTNNSRVPIQYRVVEFVETSTDTDANPSYKGEKVVNGQNVTVSGAWGDYYSETSDTGATSTVGKTAWALTITNSRKTDDDTVTISGAKIWVEKGNTGNRPVINDNGSANIALKLRANGVLVRNADGSIKQPTWSDANTEDNQWEYTYSGLPKYRNGALIEYTVEEVAVPGYTTSYGVGNTCASVNEKKDHDTWSADGITNTLDTVDITVRKYWNDYENGFATRPDSITVTLYANGVEKTKTTAETVWAESSDTTWTYTFTNLPKYDPDGNLIQYTISEGTVNGYKLAAVTPTGSNGVSGVINTNSINPSASLLNNLDYINIEGRKIWDDNNSDIRPDEITVGLYVGNDLVTMKDGTEATATVKASENWTYSFKGLPKVYKLTNQPIQYTVKEVQIPIGYTTTEGDSTNGYVVRNTLETIDITVNKTWNLKGLDVSTPSTITVKVMNGETEVRKAIIGLDGSIPMTGTTINDDTWSYTFTGLPKYEKVGNGVQEIKYTITEEPIVGYESTVSEVIQDESNENKYVANITNTIVPIKVEVEKVWEDDNDKHGIRPDSIIVTLYADGKEVAEQEVTAENEWKCTFNDLPEYNADGNKIVYTVVEDDVFGYTSKVASKVDGYTITNALETMSVSGTKTWNLNGQKVELPESITVKVMNGDTVVATQKVTAEDNWKYSFDNLPKYENVDGEVNEIVYKVVEEPVAGYKASYNGYDITNTIETVSVSGTKTWNLKGQKVELPASITVKVMNGNTVVASQKVTAKDDWKYTFENLPKVVNGKEVVYTVAEEYLEDYEVSYDGYNITNTLIENHISVEKKWIGDVGAREIDVVAKLDGKTVKVVTLSAANNWKATITWYGSMKGDWKFEEANVPAYYISFVGDMKLSGMDEHEYSVTVTNLYDPPEVEEDDDDTRIVVKKVWIGGDEENRPEVKVQLYKNDKAYKKAVTIDEDDNWRHVWDNLSDSKKIEWSVKEVEVPAGYSSQVTKVNDYYFIITNTWVENKPNPETGAN